MLQFAFKLVMKDDLLDLREIPTRRRVGIVFSLVKSNHYTFPKNPCNRCMLAWNSLPVDISLLDSKCEVLPLLKEGVDFFLAMLNGGGAQNVLGVVFTR